MQDHARSENAKVLLQRSWKCFTLRYTDSEEKPGSCWESLDMEKEKMALTGAIWKTLDMISTTRLQLNDS